MTDDLVRRIEKYNDRIRIIYNRRRAEEREAWEEECRRAEEDGWEEEPDEEPVELPEEELPAEGPAAPEEIPPELFFDAAEEIIGGYPWGPYNGRGMYSVNRCGIHENLFRAVRRYPEHLRYIVSPDNPWYFDIDGVVYSRETGLLVSFPRGREEYTVPEDDRITGIGDLAFAGSGLKRIVLSDRIRWIGHYAFTQCTQLEEITLPVSVEFLGSYAFAGCVSLKKADLSCGIREIPRRCFIDDALLESVILPPDVSAIDRGAFSYCVSLKSVKAAGVTGGEYDVIFPASLERIGGASFAFCESIRSVYQKSGPAVVEDKAFMGCFALRTFVAEGVREYRAYCFQGCTRLEEVTFSPMTAKLGKDLFQSANNLKTIRFACAPDFTCATDSLPEKAVYEVDTAAWLGRERPYQCAPVFMACVRNIARGEKVPEDLYGEMLRTLKRNRKKLYEWFLSDADVMRLAVRENIPDCTDCLLMFDLALRHRMMSFHPVVKFLRGYMFRYSQKQLDKAQEKLNAAERAKEEAEQKARQLQLEELKRQPGIKPQDAGPVLKNISVEDLDLSVRAYNCLKNRGINTLADLAGLSQEDLMKFPGMESGSMKEVLQKLEDMTGIRLPEEREDE